MTDERTESVARAIKVAIANRILDSDPYEAAARAAIGAYEAAQPTPDQIVEVLIAHGEFGTNNTRNHANARECALEILQLWRVK